MGICFCSLTSLLSLLMCSFCWDNRILTALDFTSKTWRAASFSTSLGSLHWRLASSDTPLCNGSRTFCSTLTPLKDGAYTVAAVTRSQTGSTDCSNLQNNAAVNADTHRSLKKIERASRSFQTYPQRSRRLISMLREDKELNNVVFADALHINCKPTLNAVNEQKYS